MTGPGRTIRIYVDTSVIGGCLDDEFREASHRLFDRSLAGNALLVISDTTLVELALAPAKVRDVIEDLPRRCVEFIRQSAESEALAEEYIRQAVVSRRMLADAQHIAVATVARVDVLVSWNFRHIRQPGSHPRIQRSQSSWGLSALGDPIAAGGLER